MLFDVVLFVDGRCWRTRRELTGQPRKGDRVLVLDGVEATVAGSTCRTDAVADADVSRAVLVRLPTLPAGTAGADLRRAGWHLLL